MVLQCQVRMSDCKRKCMLRSANVQVCVKWFCDWNVNKFLFPLLLHPDDYLMRCMIHSCLRYLWIQNSRQKERQFYKLIWMDNAHFTSLILYNLLKQTRLKNTIWVHDREIGVYYSVLFYMKLYFCVLRYTECTKVS